MPAFDFVREPVLRRRLHSATWPWLAATTAGCLLAVILPNRLEWAPRDFASSAEHLLDGQTGTGRARLIQSRTTLLMIRSAPLWGTGPGNWPIKYADYAKRGDPSYTPAALFPAPAVPRGDLLSLTAEFGIAGLVLIGIAITGVIRHSLTTLRSSAPSERRSAEMIFAMLCALFLLGLLDPIVRAPPTFAFATVAIGAAIAGPAKSRRVTRLRRAWWAGPATLAVCAAGSLWLANSALRDTLALRVARAATSMSDLNRAVRVAPHNFVVRAMIASVLVQAGRCQMAEPHLLQAARLEPLSGAIRNLRERCSPIAGCQSVHVLSWPDIGSLQGTQRLSRHVYAGSPWCRASCVSSSASPCSLSRAGAAPADSRAAMH
jgi:hypothetical protein